MAEYIDRQTVFDAINKEWEGCGGLYGSWVIITDILSTIDELPVADVRPVVRGRWVRHYCDEDGKPDGWACDKCKEWYFFGPSKPNFCPNCGADMRGDTDG